MSNPFTVKANNTQVRVNAFTSDRRHIREHAISEYHRKQDAILQAKRDQEALEKQRAYEDALDARSYPALLTTLSSPPEPRFAMPVSYADQIKKEQINDTPPEDPDIASLKPGWTLLRKLNGLQIYKHPSSTTPCEPVEDEGVLRTRVFDALADLHEVRTNDFIDHFGYEVWEDTFMFPRWREDQLSL